nr:putative transposase (putative), gypsy type [Tanacetum cinerariifolium]
MMERETSITSYTFSDGPSVASSANEVLEAKFQSHFSQQKKFTKTHLVVHNIKQREGESTRAFVTSFVKGPPRRVYGFVDSHTGIHPEDDFTPLKTIRRLCSIFGRRSHLGFEGETSEPKGRVRHQAPQSNVMYAPISALLSTINVHQKSKTMSHATTIRIKYLTHLLLELNEFLSSYSIPSEYCVILPTPTQTILDAPPRTFIVMCKAYDCEPSVELLHGFFNLFKAGSWLTFQKRSKKHISSLLAQVITRIEGWDQRFFFIQDTIVPSKFPQLLLKENMLDVKS